MINLTKRYDCVIIGGGMFGLYAASLMSSLGAKVAILEKENAIFSRASKVNQSRVHRGYHYPRSYETAQKTSSYYHRFCQDFDFALLGQFKQYYSISKKDSKVSAVEFAEFCNKLNLPLKEIDSSLFFQNGKVEATFEVDEACFNYFKIKEYFLDKFKEVGNVDIYYEVSPISSEISGTKYILELNNFPSKLVTSMVINTTYKNVNELNRMFGFSEYKVKYELCELALCEIGDDLAHNGLTVLDGPFFSFMPFGDGTMSTLSSVRHTPIETNYFEPQNKRCDMLNNNKKETANYSNWTEMKSLTKNYLKQNLSFKYKNSFFEIKPILISSEEDDSRPTIISVNSKTPLFISVLAGKITTIYDLEEILSELG